MSLSFLVTIAGGALCMALCWTKNNMLKNVSIKCFVIVIYMRAIRIQCRCSVLYHILFFTYTHMYILFHILEYFLVQTQSYYAELIFIFK